MVPAISDVRDESTALAQRALLGVCLAEAWREPRAAGGEVVKAAPQQLDSLAGAWRAVIASTAAREMSELGLGELTSDRASIELLIDWLGADPARRGAAHEAVFGLIISKDCPPYETEFCHWNDPTYRSSQMADVGGFYRAFGLRPRRERPERQDHVSLEIEFVAFLQQKLALAIESGEAEHVSVCREALAAFVRDHAAWWMPTFAGCVKRRITRLRSTPEGAAVADLLSALDGVADLLRAWIAIVRQDCGVEPVREIIAPNVPNWSAEQEGDDCGSCEGLPACTAADSPAP